MKITWTFTVEEENYVLAALGARPFNKVAPPAPTPPDA